MSSPIVPETGGKVPEQSSGSESESVAGSSPGARSDNGGNGHGPQLADTNEVQLVKEMRPVRGRAAVFSALLVTTVVDLIFLAIWVALQDAGYIGLHMLAETARRHVGGLPRANSLVADVLDYLFIGSTSLVVVVFLVRDFWLTVKRVGSMK